MASCKYTILFKRSAEKELRGIPQPDLARILRKITTLSDHPRPAEIQMLKGDNCYFRLRQGDYRIVYEVDDASQEVAIIKIGHRREVYK